MKKKLFILISSLFAIFFCAAQTAPSNIISSQGGYAKADYISLEWTVGETVASTFSSPNYIYTQGFNQSFIVVGKAQTNGSKEWVSVFAAPNPVTANLNVSIESLVASRYAVVITNLHGVKVYQRYASLESRQISIDMRSFVNGVYLLQVYDTHNKLVSTSKIIKL